MVARRTTVFECDICGRTDVELNRVNVAFQGAHRVTVDICEPDMPKATLATIRRLPPTGRTRRRLLSEEEIRKEAAAGRQRKARKAATAKKKTASRAKRS